MVAVARIDRTDVDVVPHQFDGQVAVVTGAGRGLGRAYALELARRGAKVLVNDWAGRHDPLNLDGEIRADRVVGEIEGAGGEAIASHDDVGDPQGARAAVAAALSQWGTIDVLINNAGFLRNGYFEELTEQQIEEILSVHLRAAFYVTQPAWKVMKAKGYGRVVLTSSSSGVFSHQGLANYAAAKAGMLGLGRALAYEGREHDLKANCLLPYAATPIGAEQHIPHLAEEFARHVPPQGNELMGSRGAPEAVAPMAVFLASRACPVSGQAFSICMGRYARVFTAIAHGWTSSEAPGATVEDIAVHFAEIGDLDAPFTIPADMYEEIADATNSLIAGS
jgi:NAD(P)-dependent dehydrogenase (short-subunit alcohol dehydrogenase family)